MDNRLVLFWKIFLLLPRLMLKNAKKKKKIYDKWFLSKMFSQIKMQAATNWSSHLKNIKHLILFQTTDTYLMQFSKITFSEIFENHL